MKYNLFIKNIPIEASEEEVRKFFANFGEIKNLKVIKKDVINIIAKEPTQYGFVSFTSAETA